MRGSGEARAARPGSRPRSPPRVVTLLGLYSLLGLLCLPALPVAMATAALLRTWPRLRPWLVATVAAVALAGSWPPGGRRCSAATCSASTSRGGRCSPSPTPARRRGVLADGVRGPGGLPLGVLLGAAHMLHSDHATRGLPWHPRTIQRTAASNARAGRQVARTLERMPPFVDDAPALGAVYDGELPAWQHGPYAVLPRELRGRAITLAGAPGVGKTVLQRRLVAADAARGRRVVFIDAKATEPTLAAELIAAYTAGAGFVPRVKLWPAEPLSGWEGRPDGAGQPPAGRPGLVRALV